jgi:hypothetical protein
MLEIKASTRTRGTDVRFLTDFCLYSLVSKDPRSIKHLPRKTTPDRPIPFAVTFDSFLKSTVSVTPVTFFKRVKRSPS